MINKLKSEIREMKLLFRSIPSLMMTLFIVSVIAMNLLANKSIQLPWEFLALDCGILISWLSFLSMDVITKHFGPKAATQASIVAALINLGMCLIFFIASRIPGIWSESYVPGMETVINHSLDATFGGVWYVLLGSTIAFLISSIVNNYSNALIGKFCKDQTSFKTFMTRTYISTALGQFCDNLLFALIVSHQFFGWTLLQCITCAITGMLVELLCEVIFAYPGYRILKSWRKEQVGKAFFAYQEQKKQ